MLSAIVISVPFCKVSGTLLVPFAMVTSTSFNSVAGLIDAVSICDAAVVVGTFSFSVGI